MSTTPEEVARLIRKWKFSRELWPFETDAVMERIDALEKALSSAENALSKCVLYYANTQEVPFGEPCFEKARGVRNELLKLLASEPKCDRCGQPATKRKETFLFCDACAPKNAEPK